MTRTERVSARTAIIVLAALLAVGFALRLQPILRYDMGPNTYSDDNGYITSGAVFLTTGYVGYSEPYRQTSAITFGMPVVVGALLGLFGRTPAGMLAAHAAFACFGLLTALGAYLLGELIADRFAGLCAAGLCALEPGLMAVNAVFLTESPYMCLNLFAIYGFLRCAREWHVGWFWCATLCMLAATAFKGLGLLAALPAAAVLIRKRAPWRSWLPKVGMVALAFVLFFLPWWVRNLKVTGEFVPFTTNRGDIQLLGSYDGIGCPEGTYDEMILQLDKEAWEMGYQDDVPRRFERRGEEGKARLSQWVREHPIGFVVSHVLYKPLKLTVQHLAPVRVWGLPEALMNGVWWLCLALAAWGLICPRFGGVAREGYYAPLAYLMIACFVTAIYAPLPRYGVPHVPLWLMYGGAGVADLWRRMRGRIG